MARLVEVGEAIPATLTVRAGDLLNFSASGGLVERGKKVLRPLGPFKPGVVGLNGRLLSPETVPTNMLFHAVGPGKARLTLFAGGGLVPAVRHSIDVIVEAEPARR